MAPRWAGCCFSCWKLKTTWLILVVLSYGCGRYGHGHGGCDCCDLVLLVMRRVMKRQLVHCYGWHDNRNPLAQVQGMFHMWLSVEVGQVAPLGCRSGSPRRQVPRRQSIWVWKQGLKQLTPSSWARMSPLPDTPIISTASWLHVKKYSICTVVRTRVTCPGASCSWGSIMVSIQGQGQEEHGRTMGWFNLAYLAFVNHPNIGDFWKEKHLW